MKRILTITMFAGCVGLLISGTTIAQTKVQPQAQKTEKHIKMIKVDDNGKKTELDTVITGNKPFVWNGDTIGGGKELKWISKDNFVMDSIHKNFDMNFEYNIDDDGEGNVIIMKSGKGRDNHMMMRPGMPMPPNTPRVMMFKSNKNVIDLSDPGIISYDKKLRKDGTEKITIVRKQVPEGKENEEKIIMHAPHGPDANFSGNAPKQMKTMKVIKDSDGNTQIFEDGKLIELKENKGKGTFISDDEKVIKIKEIKEGGAKKVEVIVEEEKK